MTIVEAIRQALIDLGEPSTYPQIYKKIIERNYFQFNAEEALSVVRVHWPPAWDQVNKKSALNKTIGFFALMRVLRDILRKMIVAEGHDAERVLSQPEYHNILDGGALDAQIFETWELNSKSSKAIYDLVTSNLALNDDENL